jgi:hypothetical protein
VTTGNTTVNGSPVTVTPGAQPIHINITTPAAAAAASAAPLAAAAHSAVLALAALLALVAF